jgi:hypothetical protein
MANVKMSNGTSIHYKMLARLLQDEIKAAAAGAVTKVIELPIIDSYRRLIQARLILESRSARRLSSSRPRNGFSIGRAKR